jgi:CheY-like chemotaxis protein
MLSLALEATGYTAHVVSDGDEALAYLAATYHLPDVIISEFALPGWEQTQFLDTLRQDPIWESIPVIVMAVRDQSPDRKIAIQHGANAFLTKPFTFVELSSILERWGLSPFERPATCTVS